MPLVGAINGGHFEIVRLLVEHGADVNALWGSFTPLSYAVMRGNREIIDFLRVYGAKEPHELSKNAACLPQLDLPISFRDHIETHFGKLQPERLQQNLPTQPKMNVLWAKGEGKQYLITWGMSACSLNPPRGLDSLRHVEFVIELPPTTPLHSTDVAESNWAAEWLLKATSLIANSNSWIAPQGTIIVNGNPPQPLTAGIPFVGFLANLMEEERNIVRLPTGTTVVIFLLFPVFREEYELERREGIAQLLGRLAENHIPTIANPKRKNVGI